jgi:hypothetical protein
MELLRLVKEGSTPSLSLPNSGLGVMDASTFFIWSLIPMTTSQLKSTTKVTKLTSEATKDFSDIKSWKVKEGMKAVLVQEAEPITIRKADGTRKEVKDQYILLKWSEKLSLILEIPETITDPVAFVAEINAAGYVDMHKWGKYFPMAKERLF